MRILLFILGCILISLNGLSSTTQVVGEASEYAGYYISVFKIEDHYTKKGTELGQVLLDSTGTFQFDLDIDQTTLLQFQIDQTTATLYAAPNTHYRIRFPKPDDKGKAIRKLTTELDILELPPFDINRLIVDFNMQYEAFFAKNYVILGQYTRGNATAYARSKKLDNSTFEDSLNTTDRELDSLLLDFKQTLNLRYDTIDNDYFKTHVRFALANLDLSLFQNKAKHQALLTHQKTQWESAEYCTFVQAFFEHHFFNFSQQKRHQKKCEAWIEQGAWDSLSTYLQQELQLNKEISDFVLLTGLFEIKKRPNIQRDHLNQLFNAYLNKDDEAIHSQLTRNLLHFLNRLKPKSVAPTFALQDLNGDTLTLDSLKGKYVYLAFWDDWCETCISELQVLENVPVRDVVLVGICMNPDTFKAKQAIQELQGRKVQHYFTAEKNKLESQYRIASLPHYVLLGPKGEIMSSPALSPSPNGVGSTIFKDFHSIHMKLHPRKRKQVGGKLNRR